MRKTFVLGALVAAVTLAGCGQSAPSGSAGRIHSPCYQADAGWSLGLWAAAMGDSGTSGNYSALQAAVPSRYQKALAGNAGDFQAWRERFGENKAEAKLKQLMLSQCARWGMPTDIPSPASAGAHLP